MEPDVSFLRECFTYDPEQGQLFWKTRPADHFKTDEAFRAWNKKYAGREAGHTSQRYRKLTLTVEGVKKIYSVHRVAWAVHSGEWPAEQLDHKNQNKADIRIGNLREATHVQNMQNRRPRCANKTGYRGVYELPSGRFVAKIKVGKQRLYLGAHDTREEAYASYCAAAYEHFGEFACLT